MKRVLGVIFTAALMLCCVGCGKKATAINQAGITLGISVEGGIVEEHADTHGGFHGDGMTYSRIRFEDKTFAKKAAVDPHWNALPMTENLSTLIWGDGFTSIFDDTEGNPLIPRIKDGLYYFYDRHSESTDRYSDKDLNNRASYNFDAAVYDSENNVLYFIKFDT